jgi:hypothetical protein
MSKFRSLYPEYNDLLDDELSRKLYAGHGMPLRELTNPWSSRLRGKLKHGRLLAFEQLGQEDHLPIGKFKGIMMHARLVFIDLPEDRRPGGHSARRTEAEEPGCCTGDLPGECKLRSRKDADRCLGIFGRGEPTSTVPKLRVASLSPTFAERDFTFCRL